MANETPPDWLLPIAPGKQYVIPDPGQYRFHNCRDPVHIFRDRPSWCKCRSFFWPAVDQFTRSRIDLRRPPGAS